jgi:hypothetical protein
MTDLQYLNLRKCPRVTDHGGIAISTMTSLRVLLLGHCAIDSSVAHFTSLQRLCKLQLAGCHNVRPQSVKPLSQLKLLFWVEMLDCPKLESDPDKQVVTVQM